MIVFYINIRMWIGKKFMFHFENIYAFIGFMLNWAYNLNFSNIIKKGNEYVWNWLANIFFKPTFTLQARYILIRMWKRWKVTNKILGPH
jgi:hypothetical protein